VEGAGASAAGGGVSVAGGGVSVAAGAGAGGGSAGSAGSVTGAAAGAAGAAAGAGDLLDTRGVARYAARVPPSVSTTMVSFAPTGGLDTRCFAMCSLATSTPVPLSSQCM